MTKLLSILLFTSLTATAAELTPDQIDSELNSTYQEALKTLSAQTGYALKNNQRDWLKFTKSFCSLTQGTYHIYTEEHLQNEKACISKQNKDRITFIKNLMLDN